MKAFKTKPININWQEITDGTRLIKTSFVGNNNFDKAQVDIPKITIHALVSEDGGLFLLETEQDNYPINEECNKEIEVTRSSYPKYETEKGKL